MRKMKEELLKNPLMILDNEKIINALKKHWIVNHQNLVNPKEFVEEFFSYLKTERDNKEFSAKKINKQYKRKLREYRQVGQKTVKPRDMFLEIINSQWDGISVVLDFGCGKLAFLKELAEYNKKIEKMIGIDSGSRPLLGQLDGRIEFHRTLKDITPSSVDIAVIKLVLHHLKKESEIADILSDIRNVLRPKGKLIVFEESFSEEIIESDSIRAYLNQFSLELSMATVDFMQLVKEEKKEFLFFNDWLMNLQNDYMPWTGLYKSIGEWGKIGEGVGFRKKEMHFLGAIAHRKRKQGMTAYMVWEK
jgi:SAM-dependent methyltransferase